MTESVSDTEVKIERINLEDLDVYSPDVFLQKSYWAVQKQAFGWKAHAFSVSVSHPPIQSAVLVLERRVWKDYSFLYVPHGPDQSTTEEIAVAWKQTRGAVLSACARQISRGFERSKVIFVRYDLDWVVNSRPCVGSDSEPGEASQPRPVFDAEKTRSELNFSPLKRARTDVQPPDTVHLSLVSDEETLLKQMRAKTRYNIRLAEKKGVRVVRATPDQLAEWYHLYRITSDRDRIAIHSFEYYQSLLLNCVGFIDFLLAYHEDELLAGIVVLYSGKRATYLYGASGNSKRNLMPAYALQWAAIRAAMARGSVTYDFFGAPPSNSPDHPMHGLYQFKTGFGGNFVSMAGCWDVQIRPFLHLILGRVESLRSWYFKKFRKHGA